MTGSYYHRLPSSGDAQRFAASEITASAWGPNLQHGSPPLALLTKVVEERLAGSGQRIGRLWTYLGEHLSLETELERINAVTLDDMRSLAQQYPFAPRTRARLIPKG